MKALKDNNVYASYAIVPLETYYVVKSPHGKSFAILDSHITRILHEVQDVGPVRLQAIIQHGPTDNYAIENIGSTTQKRVIEISINLYGILSLAKTMGDALSKERKFLQHPDAVDSGVSYVNPQYFCPPGESGNLDHMVGTGRGKPSSMQSIDSEVDRIMDSLDKMDDNPYIPQCGHVLTPLMRYIFPLASRIVLMASKPSACSSRLHPAERSFIGERSFRANY